jgi:hypothetical protein
MRRTLITIVAFGALLVISGCASSATTRAQSEPDRITSTEMSGSNATNAYELINRVRPNWLRRTAPGSLSGGVRSQVVLVYIDGTKYGELSTLRSLGISGLKSIQWLDAVRAGTLLPNIGSEPIAGAIVITTR